MIQRPLDGLDATTGVGAVTRAVQQALDSCGDAGGGSVVLDVPGTWTTDGLVLRSHVELRIERGVTLRASGREEHYTQRPGPFELLRNQTPISGFLYGTGLEGTRIAGEGTIDGNYEAFILPGQPADEVHLKSFAYPRPMTVYLEDCRDTVIEGVTITNAPFWTVHLVGCTATRARDVTIRNDMRMPNTDGFDIDRCTDTLIERCTIVTGDDAICPKCTEETARYGDCEGLVVRDCVLESQSSAIKFGSSSFGTFRDADFQRITIRDSNRGIAFQLRDAGGAEHIRFRDITVSTRRFAPQWWGSGEPVYITILGRDPDSGMAGHAIEDVEFREVRCSSDNASLVHADDGALVRDIRFVDCSFELRREAGSPTTFDLRPRTGGEAELEAPAAAVVTTVPGVGIDGVPLPVTPRPA